MPRNKIYTERIELCITKRQKRKLILEARREEKNYNEILRDLIDAFLI